MLTYISTHLSTWIRSFINNEEGASAIEYGLIAALVAVAIVVVLGTVGDELFNTFTTVSTKLGTAGG